MTLDEAIKHAEEVAEEKRYEYQDCLAVYDMENAMVCGKCGEEHEQLAEWLKELKQLREQEPCENAISREQAMDIIYKIKENHTSDRENHPINYGTLCDINLQLINLPSVTPTSKKGHWISIYGNVKCSVCGNIKDGRSVGKATHYCDFCGAKMEVEE